MSLTTAINTAQTSLSNTSTQTNIVSRNIANASNPDYNRRNAALSTNVYGAQVVSIQRAQDQALFLQQQLRTSTASAASLNLKSVMLGRIDRMFGTPDSNSSIAGSISALATMLQELADNPESDAARQSLLSEAGNLAAKMNTMSDTIQDMRLEAERNIADGVEQANALLKTIADVNNQIAQRQAGNQSVGDLQDKRDMAIDELSRLMDVKVVNRDDGTVTVFTSGGQLLLDRTPVELAFDERTQIDATSTHENGGVGTIRLISGSNSIDLMAAGAIRSGALAGYIEMRDEVLTQAQTQLDELAAQLALSMSEETVASDPVTAGAATGLEIDTSSMLSGNTISLSYTVGGARQDVTVVRVDDPSVLPLTNSATANPDDTVIGVNFNQPMANIIADLQAALPRGWWWLEPRRATRSVFSTTARWATATSIR